MLEGKTGIFFDRPSVESLSQTITRFNDIYQYSIKPEDCRKQAEKFNKARFRREILNFVEEKMEGHYA